jgi:hypothetical protein
MSATTTTMNGKPRKQLADQLDRLDGIIDALADGLNQAVIDAAREGTRLAVKDAIVEIMTNPELRALLAPARPEPVPVPVPVPTPPEVGPEPKAPGLWTRIKAKVAAARDALTVAATKAKEAVATRYQAASDTVAAVGTAAGEALPLRRVLWVGLGAGLLVGLVCLVVPHAAAAAAAAVSAVSVAATTVAVQTGTWLKKAARRFGLVG